MQYTFKNKWFFTKTVGIIRVTLKKKPRHITIAAAARKFELYSLRSYCLKAELSSLSLGRLLASRVREFLEDNVLGRWRLETRNDEIFFPAFRKLTNKKC